MFLWFFFKCFCLILDGEKSVEQANHCVSVHLLSLISFSFFLLIVGKCRDLVLFNPAQFCGVHFRLGLYMNKFGLISLAVQSTLRFGLVLKKKLEIKPNPIYEHPYSYTFCANSNYHIESNE